MSNNPELSGALVRARVLVSGVYGKVDDIVEISADQVSSMAGVVDADPAAVAYAESLSESGGPDSPTVAELQAAHAELLRRRSELDERQLRLDEQEAAILAKAERLAEQAAANATEAQRLADETFARAAADKITAEAATAELKAAAAPAADTKPGKAAK